MLILGLSKFKTYSRMINLIKIFLNIRIIQVYNKNLDLRTANSNKKNA